MSGIPPLEAEPCEGVEQHCFHPSGEMYTSSPGQWVERCCNCGNWRRRIESRFADDDGHGPFLIGRPILDLNKPDLCPWRDRNNNGRWGCSRHIGHTGYHEAALLPPIPKCRHCGVEMEPSQDQFCAARQVLTSCEAPE